MKNMINFPTIPVNFFNFALRLSFASLMLGCSSTNISERSKAKIAKVSNQQIFHKPYEQVWRAAQLTLRYPLSINNMDTGVIETDVIKAFEGFMTPGRETPVSTGTQYKIVMILAKGGAESNNAVRVTVNKIIERTRDFFSDPEPLVSDGFEEQIILYRMGRELSVDELIKKVNSAEK